LDDLYKVDRNYNNTFHSGIDDVPTEIWNGKKLEIEPSRFDENLDVEPTRFVEKLDVGDHFRVILKRNELEKNNFTKMDIKNLLCF
jgi:hypothetical protein